MYRILATLIAALFAVLVAGCPTDLGIKEFKYGCESDSDCGKGYVCLKDRGCTLRFKVDAGFIDVGGVPDSGAGDTGELPDAGGDTGLPDAGVDAGVEDTGMDVGGDDGFIPDGAGDAAVDGGHDTGSDAGGDTGADAGSDAGVDAGADAGYDAGLDAGFDAGNPACNAGNCPSGCCAGTICRNGNINTECGKGGVACDNCTSQGGTCKNQVCDIPPPVCNSTTCPNGCCDAQAQCQTGTTDTVCGKGGAFCQNCTSSGETCTNQTCHGSNCDSITCPGGCCSNNVCEPGILPTKCGKGGAACTSCGIFKPDCINQACALCALTSCGFQDKCCDSTGGCQTGDSDSQCGKGAEGCTNCAGSGQACFYKNCHGCDALTCPDGCCEGNVCKAGTENTACGTDGAACGNCTTQSKACGNHACTACNPTSCPNGCCDAAGACQPGNVDASCGIAGAVCQNCSAGGQTCGAGQKCSVCNASTCPTGCCDATGNCRPGALNDQCGKTGGACADCDTTITARACVSQACTCTKKHCNLMDDYNCCDPADNTCKYGGKTASCGENGAQCANCGSNYCCSHACQTSSCN